jgi:hypothetical protein
MGLWNSSDSLTLFIFIWDFGTVPTVWHYLLKQNATLSEHFQSPIEKQMMPHCRNSSNVPYKNKCGIICFDMGLWNCSDSVALFVFLMVFDTVPTVWHHLLIYWTLEMFRQK